MNHSALNCKDRYYIHDYVNKIFGDYICIDFEHSDKKRIFSYNEMQYMWSY